MSEAPESRTDLAAVPLFPLPNVVLLPRAVLPLHVFEERYKQMTADVLRSGHGLIAMALLRPGWERDYYQAPAIEPVVCVGRILSHERLADGRYNFLLQGAVRARVVRETRQQPYRVAELAEIAERPVAEGELAAYRKRLARAVTAGALAGTKAGIQFAKLVASRVTTADVADLMAFNLIEDLKVRQALLAEGDVARRVRTVTEAVERLAVDPSLN